MRGEGKSKQGESDGCLGLCTRAASREIFLPIDVHLITLSDSFRPERSGHAGLSFELSQAMILCYYTSKS